MELGETSFNSEDLIPHTWQYAVCHQSNKCFKTGEKVFLKSNPDKVLIVALPDFKGGVLCFWFDNDENLSSHVFTPQTILQYRYRPLIISSDKKYSICLN